MAAVQRAEVIAQQVGEPYGSLVLAVGVHLVLLAAFVFLVANPDPSAPQCAVA